MCGHERWLCLPCHAMPCTQDLASGMGPARRITASGAPGALGPARGHGMLSSGQSKHAFASVAARFSNTGSGALNGPSPRPSAQLYGADGAPTPGSVAPSASLPRGQLSMLQSRSMARSCVSSRLPTFAPASAGVVSGAGSEAGCASLADGLVVGDVVKVEQSGTWAPNWRPGSSSGVCLGLGGRAAPDGKLGSMPRDRRGSLDAPRSEAGGCGVARSIAGSSGLAGAGGQAAHSTGGSYTAWSNPVAGLASDTASRVGTQGADADISAADSRVLAGRQSRTDTLAGISERLALADAEQELAEGEEGEEGEAGDAAGAHARALLERAQGSNWGKGANLVAHPDNAGYAMAIDFTQHVSQSSPSSSASSWGHLLHQLSQQVLSTRPDGMSPASSRARSFKASRSFLSKLLPSVRRKPSGTAGSATCMAGLEAASGTEQCGTAGSGLAAMAAWAVEGRQASRYSADASDYYGTMTLQSVPSSEASSMVLAAGPSMSMSRHLSPRSHTMRRPPSRHGSTSQQSLSSAAPAAMAAELRERAAAATAAVNGAGEAQLPGCSSGGACAPLAGTGSLPLPCSSAKREEASPHVPRASASGRSAADAKAKAGAGAEADGRTSCCNSVAAQRRDSVEFDENSYSPGEVRGLALFSSATPQGALHALAQAAIARSQKALGAVHAGVPMRC